MMGHRREQVRDTRREDIKDIQIRNQLTDRTDQPYAEVYALVLEVPFPSLWKWPR